MSGEGTVVNHNGMEIVEGEALQTPTHAEDKEQPPRGAQDMAAEPDTEERGGVSKERDADSDNTNEEAKNRVSDDGDHVKPAPDDFTLPDDDLSARIIKQVEFYFSDTNIVKDTFLMKHVRQNKDGFVNLKLIASFKKMKNLTKDVRVIAYCLRQSEELEVNEKGNKVKRRKPIPEYDERTPCRTVVAVNLVDKNPTVDSVAKEFSDCEGITLIRVVRPNHKIPADVERFAYKHRELGTAVCAVIEFETEEQATKACRTMTNTEDWRSGRRVGLLGDHKQKKGPKNGNKENGASQNDGGSKNAKGNAASRKKTHGDHKPAEKKSSSGGSGSDGDSSGSSQSHPHSSSADGKSDHSSPHSTPKSSPPSVHRELNGRFPQPEATSQNGAHHPSYRKNKETSRKKKQPKKESSPPSCSSPWVQRRLRAAQDAKVGGSAVTECGNGDGPSHRNSKLLNMVGVLRQPKGPDGTRGFSAGLGRGTPRCNTIT